MYAKNSISDVFLSYCVQRTISPGGKILHKLGTGFVNFWFRLSLKTETSITCDMFLRRKESGIPEVYKLGLL